MNKKTHPVSDLLLDLVPDDFFPEDDPLLGCAPADDLPEDRTHEEQKGGSHRLKAPSHPS